nr:MAG TPA: protein of unknown function (DUF4868) [Caudoviricetes sp.]
MEENITDIFLFINKLDADRDKYAPELYLFNNNFTVYSIGTSNEVSKKDLDELFLYDVIKEVELGAGTGANVRHISYKGEDEQKIFWTAKVSEVMRVDVILDQFERLKDIKEFGPYENAVMNMRGIIVRYVNVENPKDVFYVIKQLQKSSFLVESTAWTIHAGYIKKLGASGAFKIPTGNQVLVTGSDIFMFDLSKFEKMFKYEARKMVVVQEKGKQLEEFYKFNFPVTIGLGFADFVKDSSTLVNKMQNLEIGVIPQSEVIKIAQKFCLELMVTDDQRIIIMDEKDARVFLDIISDSYVESLASSKYYLAKSKKDIEYVDGQ